MNKCVISFSILLLMAAGARAAGDVQPPAPAFFQNHCVRCHGPDKQKADFRLDTLSRDFAVQTVAERWAEVMFRINNGEMPPRKETQPAPDEMGTAVDWIAARLKESEATRMAKRVRVAHYRLSREEYGHTIEDLLGVHFDVDLPGAFNEDPRWLAGWIDHVELLPGGSGIVTFTLLNGSDPSLYDEIRALSKPGSRGFLAAGEYTLRTWWQEHDSKSGPVMEFKETPTPPPGSSGIQLRVKVNEVLEGYRPSRIIRFRPSSWPYPKLPPEERIQNLEDRQRMQMGLGSK